MARFSIGLYFVSVVVRQVWNRVLNDNDDDDGDGGGSVVVWLVT